MANLPAWPCHSGWLSVFLILKDSHSKSGSQVDGVVKHVGQQNLYALTEAIKRRLRKGGSRFHALIESYLNDAHPNRTEHGCIIAALSSEMTRHGPGISN